MNVRRNQHPSLISSFYKTHSIEIEFYINYGQKNIHDELHHATGAATRRYVVNKQSGNIEKSWAYQGNSPFMMTKINQPKTKMTFISNEEWQLFIKQYFEK